MWSYDFEPWHVNCKNQLYLALFINFSVATEVKDRMNLATRFSAIVKIWGKVIVTVDLSIWKIILLVIGLCIHQILPFCGLVTLNFDL